MARRRGLHSGADACHAVGASSSASSAVFERTFQRTTESTGGDACRWGTPSDQPGGSSRFRELKRPTSSVDFMVLGGLVHIQTGREQESSVWDRSRALAQTGSESVCERGIDTV